MTNDVRFMVYLVAILAAALVCAWSRVIGASVQISNDRRAEIYREIRLNLTRIDGIQAETVRATKFLLADYRDRKQKKEARPAVPKKAPEPPPKRGLFRKK